MGLLLLQCYRLGGFGKAIKINKKVVDLMKFLPEHLIYSSY